MDAVMEIAKQHNLFVIEDNAQAIGADYTFENGTTQKAGTIGNVGTTSFFPSKNLGCYGDGGAIFTNDDALAHTIRGIVNHGMYERYYHDVVGVNSRLDSIQAGVLQAKLPNLDSYCDARRNAARFYNNALANNPNIITPSAKSNKTKNCNAICDVCDCHVFHQYTLQITNGKRDELHKHLLENGIPNAIYYPVALHSQKAYADTKYKEEDFPVTNNLIKTVISLPMHTELDNEQLGFITKTIIAFLK
jgi:dTDP-4-amino-4,6-dideoxygalactose transaminase